MGEKTKQAAVPQAGDSSNDEAHTPAFTQERGNAFEMGQLGQQTEEPSILCQAMDEGPSIGAAPSANRLSDKARDLPHRWGIPELDRQPYSHGGFMASAPDLLMDANWSRALEVLMPDVYNQVLAKVEGGAKSKDLVMLFENNPVMAAYGAWSMRSLPEGGPEKLGAMCFEWDVYLDARLVDAFTNGDSSVLPAMLNSALIAHGSGFDAIDENMGQRQYDDIFLNRLKTEGGGVIAEDWLELFTRALTLAADGFPQNVLARWAQSRRHYADADADAEKRKFLRGVSPEQGAPEARYMTFPDMRSMADSIRRIKRLLGVDKFSVFLEFKTRNLPDNLVNCLVGLLNRRGVHVDSVGAFDVSEVENARGGYQFIDGKSYAHPRVVHLFHHVGSALDEMQRGKIKPEDAVYFNAATLLEPYNDAGKIAGEFARARALFGGHVGFYVQENDISPQNAAELVRLANGHPEAFDLGFAWGAVNGTAPANDSDGKGYGGQHWMTGGRAPSYEKLEQCPEAFRHLVEQLNDRVEDLPKRIRRLVGSGFELSSAAELANAEIASRGGGKALHVGKDRSAGDKLFARLTFNPPSTVEILLLCDGEDERRWTEEVRIVTASESRYDEPPRFSGATR